MTPNSRKSHDASATESHRRIIGRVEKLLAVAGRSSGASEPERASAALEIVRLIYEHDLVVIERIVKPSGTRAGWKSSTAARQGECLHCGSRIAIGEKILVKSKGFDFEYAHARCAIEK